MEINMFKKSICYASLHPRSYTRKVEICANTIIGKIATTVSPRRYIAPTMHALHHKFNSWQFKLFIIIAN